MSTSVKQKLYRIRCSSRRRPDRVITFAMGCKRFFRAYDCGADTFVFERGVWTGLNDHASVLIAEKRDLRRGGRGHVVTVTTGNHSVAAVPLLGGRFWDLAQVPPKRRSETLARHVLCCNVVDGRLEISQRDVPLAKVVELDRWLTREMGLGLDEVVLADRNLEALEHYRRLGEEWRVRPLAWTEREMRAALAASRKRISSGVVYYHNARGVHFLSFPEFRRFALLAAADFGAFRRALAELVSVYEGNETSFLRQPKYRGHHEIELFGVRRGLAMDRLVPELERLGEEVGSGRTGRAGAVARVGEIVQLYLSLLSRPELADENASAFIETLYMNLTGEVYLGMGEGATPAFDDRRTALPGASFGRGVRPEYHPGADARSRVLLAGLRPVLSRDEHVEYANIYELRGLDESTAAGGGDTREIVFKTDRCPAVRSLVEKRLLKSADGYGSYVIARVGALKALGVALADYRLVHRRPGEQRLKSAYYLRTRCDGEPMDAIPVAYFRAAEGEGEDPAVLLALAALMGDAAAQNLAMKKFDPETKSPLFDVGKEIYRFDFDVRTRRMMPFTVSCCSIRGSFGWRNVACTERNLAAVESFYLGFYARALRAFGAAHPEAPSDRLLNAFAEGFENRIRALAWQLTVQRDSFEGFDPRLPPLYRFPEKWRFILWSLDRHSARLGEFRERLAALM